MLSIYSHLAITIFNAFSFWFQIFLGFQIFLLRSLEAFKKILSVIDFVQLCFWFWAANTQSYGEMGMWTWKHLCSDFFLKLKMSLILPTVTVTEGSADSFLRAAFFLNTWTCFWVFGCDDEGIWFKLSREQKRLLLPASLRHDSSKLELILDL